MLSCMPLVWPCDGCAILLIATIWSVYLLLTSTIPWCITQWEILSISPEVWVQLGDAITTCNIPNKDSAQQNLTDEFAPDFDWKFLLQNLKIDIHEGKRPADHLNEDWETVNNISFTVKPALSHTSQWTPKSMPFRGLWLSKDLL